jgi:hypothetical protein
MKYTARVPIQYIYDGTGDLCKQLDIKLTPLTPARTQVEGNVFAMISFFTALAGHYQMSLAEIREKFA